MRIEEQLRNIEGMLKELLGRRDECEGYLDVRSAAKYASVSTDTVKRWISEGRLEAYRPDTKLFVRKADIDSLMEKSILDTPNLRQIVDSVVNKIRP
ncbi:MAG: excisionase family DNA-binding protein [Candidatus Aenigmarchaeota archaeon]|nr:excisionase family DNA-binding protein [Candidatus Aenigmarchaeota archaeon]